MKDSVNPKATNVKNVGCIRSDITVLVHVVNKVNNLVRRFLALTRISDQSEHIMAPVGNMQTWCRFCKPKLWFVISN